MAQTKYILDSNAYLRLARDLHPLLGVPFGEQLHCLYIVGALDDELERMGRLKSHFAWVNSPEYVENRIKINVAPKQHKTANATAEFISAFAIDVGSNASEEDCTALAYGQVLGVPVVTDDVGMTEVAAQLNIATLRTVEVLHLMLVSGRIDVTKVRAIVNYWHYIGDLPHGIHSDYPRLFGEALPFE